MDQVRPQPARRLRVRRVSTATKTAAGVLTALARRAVLLRCEYASPVVTDTGHLLRQSLFGPGAEGPAVAAQEEEDGGGGEADEQAEPEAAGFAEPGYAVVGRARPPWAAAAALAHTRRSRYFS